MIKLIFYYQVRQERITFFFISSRMEENHWEMRAKIIDFFFSSETKEDKWEQFVRNSRHIMEPQLKFGYKKHTV